MNIYNRTQRECDEWHIPYYGPTWEDVEEAEAYGDMQYEQYRQQQLDDEQQQLGE